MTHIIKRDVGVAPAALHFVEYFVRLAHAPLLLCDADVFGLGEEAESFFAAFAADAALLHAAEGNAQVAHQPAIYPDRAGMDLLGDAMRAAHT